MSFLAEDVPGPRRLGRDRKARRAIADDLAAEAIFQHPLGALYVGAERLGRDLVDQLVSIAVARHLMPARRRFTDQARKFLANPAQEEARRLDVVSVEQIKQRTQVAFDPRFVAVP